MNTSAYIEEARIGKLYQTPMLMTVHIVTPVMMRIMPLTINLDKWGVNKLFQTSDEVIIRELKVYVDDG